LEQEGDDFHLRVGAAFDQLAKDEPDRWLVIDGDRDPVEITDDIWRQLAPRLG
jgi:thymidylate kinase